MNFTSVASADNAVVATPAPGEQKAKVVFTINDTKYTVNGVEQTMDVAPYIKDGRTFVPVRYAAQAVGVTPENILDADGKVTLIKGDKVGQPTIGSKVMVINGIAINTDVAAEISNGRAMLPFRLGSPAPGRQGNLGRSHPDRHHGALSLKAVQNAQNSGFLKGARNF